ncbi:LysR substrate-binding domain-containing protein [Cupriavidus sp. 30B13]|uniref:LysR substrate-binding domain-containing protein n=1 Tax=Cupriavidus sp. 30B13 TaxID=3384241 RepID=UPI003B8F0A2A
MRRGVPSLGSLQAFEASARHESFSKAAQELAQTHGAICKKVNELEEDLGVALFHRVRQRLVLTPSGAEYARRIRVHLDQIRRDTIELIRSESELHLDVAVGVSFAAQWLVPRLQSFYDLNPDIRLHIIGRDQPNFFDDSNFDATIYFGQHLWAGMTGAALVSDDRLVLVCAPGWCEGQRELPLERIAAAPWIYTRDIPAAWTDWGESLVGRPLEHDAPTPHYDMFVMSINATVAGQGLALLPRSLVDRELAGGQLVVAHPHFVPSPSNIYFAFPEQRRHWEPVRRFEAWLIDAAASYVRLVQAAG